MKNIILMLFLGIYFGCSEAQLLAADVSQPTSVSAFQCMANNNITFVIIRCFLGNGQVDPNAYQTIKNARQVRWGVHAYIVPCFSCGNVADQVSAIVNVLTNNGTQTWTGYVFLDVETPGLWGGQASNVAFIQSMVNQLQNYNGNATFDEGTVSIKTSYYNWIGITGNSHLFNNLPLWYIDYDGNADFNDWATLSFEGWTPNDGTWMFKQYQGNLAMCGTSVNLDYAADGL